MICLWVEGYSVTGMSAPAKKLGSFDCDSLKQAVLLFRDSLESDSLKRFVDTEAMTFWGCRFFDNETDARKSFG